MPQTLLTAGDALGLTALTAGNDGTLALVVGPAGGKLTALSIDAAGNLTFLKQPIVPVQSMVRLNTANGYGSTNTAIRRFTNVVTNQGTDITYADSATLGASFTVNANGVYAISYVGQMNTGNAVIGISINSSQLTTGINSLATPADRLSSVQVYAPGATSYCGWTGALSSGAIIRAHDDGTAASASSSIQQFTIVRVA